MSGGGLTGTILMNDVQPYAFGRAAAEPAATIGGLDKQGERFAKKLRALIEPYCGVRPGVTAKPLDNTMFMMWDACVPGFVSLSLYRLLPIKGVVALRIDASLVGQLVDRFYGGRGPGNGADKQEFTPTETRLINRVTGQIMSALVESWTDIAKLEPILVGRETGVAQADIAAADADVVVQTFEVDLGLKEKFLIEVVYPQEGLAGIEMQHIAYKDVPATKVKLPQRKIGRYKAVDLPFKYEPEAF